MFSGEKLDKEAQKDDDNEFIYEWKIQSWKISKRILRGHGISQACGCIKLVGCEQYGPGHRGGTQQTQVEINQITHLDEHH